LDAKDTDLFIFLPTPLIPACGSTQKTRFHGHGICGNLHIIWANLFFTQSPPFFIEFPGGSLDRGERSGWFGRKPVAPLHAPLAYRNGRRETSVRLLLLFPPPALPPHSFPPPPPHPPSPPLSSTTFGLHSNYPGIPRPFPSIVSRRLVL